MKKLVLGFVIAVSLMAGAAGSALATGPDTAGCLGATGSAGLSVLQDLGCGDHP